MTKTLRIAHLYPKLLNIYGDTGNIITLKYRAEKRKIEVIIDNIEIGDEIKPHDLYFIGGGQDAQQIEVSIELQKHKAFLHEEKEKGAVFLGICGGYQLFGSYYKPKDGAEIKGIDLLDVYTIAGESRFIGNVTVNTDIVNPNTLVGFENHSGLTYLQGETLPLGRILYGHGNNGKDGTEGARHMNVFGTYLHGSFLPKNVHFTDYLLKLATGENLENLDDNIEMNTHNSLIMKH